MESHAAVVMTTVSGDEAAETLAAALVGGRCAACVQRLPIASTYRWEGEVRSESEVLLLIKTAADRVDAVVEHLEAHHPYDVPEILVLPDVAAAPPYLSWLTAETRSGSD